MQSVRPAHLVLEDGTVFAGSAVGAEGVAAGEACFTTAMAGYEEAASDPSYVAQVLAFSYPLVGNYGVDATRLESERVQAEGIVMRKARPAWAEWLASRGVVALEDVDTRALGRRICLGHQLLGLALGLETSKLLFGHRGANHPVRELRSGRVLVTVQNHGFAVADSGEVEVTHISLNDGTVEGFAGDGFATVQFHPEAAPGPLDALPFFDLIASTCRSAPIFALS